MHCARSAPAFSRRATPTNGLSFQLIVTLVQKIDTSAVPFFPKCGVNMVVASLCASVLAIMPLQIYGLPFDMPEMIGQFYDDLAQREAASTLRAPRRHLLTRCEDPRHTARTNTPGEGPVLCYQS